MLAYVRVNHSLPWRDDELENETESDTSVTGFYLIYFLFVQCSHLCRKGLLKPWNIFVTEKKNTILGPQTPSFGLKYDIYYRATFD